MTLFIATDFNGSNVFPDRVSTHFIEICNLDTGYGETSIPAQSLNQVTYARTDGGVPAQRMDDLANINFPSPAGNVDIIVVGVDTNFFIEVTPGDFRPITQWFGVALPNTDPRNPTNSHLVVYDTTQCGGSGHQVIGQNGNFVALPPSVLVFHELSHAHDFAQGNTSTEEDARADENPLRDQLNIERRSLTNGDGQCGGGASSCCIVASVASGSPYSDQVGRLRKVRDRFLRSTEIGFDLFERLHHDYYRFSSTVCDQMGRSTDFKEMVSRFFVEPLVNMLEILRERSFGNQNLLLAYDEGIERCPQLKTISINEIEQAISFLEGHNLSKSDYHNTTLLKPLVEVQKIALKSPTISWAILEPLRIYLNIVLAEKQGLERQGLAKKIWNDLDQWSFKLPILDKWQDLSEYCQQQELDFISERLLLSQEAREKFKLKLQKAGV